MATAQEYASWLRSNQDKRGSSDYQTVLRAFQEARLEELQAKATPPIPQAQPQSGGIAAFKAGIEEFGGATSALMGKLGLKDEAKAEEEYQAAKKRAAEIYKPTEEWGVTKVLELLGGSVPYMAAPLAAGAAAATLPVSGPAALAATLGAAGLTSAGQFTATNLARQMEEGKKLGETSLGSAFAAAGFQALLDTAAMRMIPGIGRIFGQAGVKVTAENAKEIAEQGLKKTLADYTLKTGKAAGVEGVTEATQQVFERLQAGLSITDPKAREEYFESFLGGAVLGGTLAPAGRFIERGGEKREARGLLDAQAQKERADALKAEEERKKSPEYLLDLEARYKEADAKRLQLEAAVKQKPKKGSDPAQWAEYNQKVEALKEFKKSTMTPLTAEYTPRKAEIEKLKQAQGTEGELAALREVPQEAQTLPYYESAQATLPGMEAVEPSLAQPTEEEPIDYVTQANNLRGYLDDLRTRAQETSNLDEKLKIGAEYTRVQAALKDAEKKAKQEQQTTGKQIDTLRKKMSAAEEAGDIDAQVALAKQLKALGVTETISGTQPELTGMQTDFFAPKEVQKRKDADLERRAEALTAARPDLTAPVEETDPLSMWKASVEEAEDQAAEELLRFETLRPSGPATVAVASNITPIQNPGTLLRRIDDLTSARDRAAADADTAFGAGNKELGVKKAQEREAAQTALNNLEQTEGPGRALVALRKAQDTALMNAAELIDDLRSGRTLGGQTQTSALGINRKDYATFEEYEAALENAKREERALSSFLPKRLIVQINKQRDAFVTAAVQEAATTRKLFAKALTKDEAETAAKQMRDVFNEWVTRSMAQPAKAVDWTDKLLARMQAERAVEGKDLSAAPWVQTMKQDFIRAQMTEALTKRLGRQRMEEIAKGTVELKGAETELPVDTRRAIQSKASVDFDRLLKTAQEKALAQSTDPRPLEERQFGAYRRAVDVLKEQLNEVATNLRQVPREFRREEQLLKMQFPETEAAKVAEARGETAQTAEGAMRRRRDYVSGLIEQALRTRKVPGIAEGLLERVKELTDANRGVGALLDAAEDAASRILKGQVVERRNLVTLRDEIRAERMRPGEAEVVGERVGQRELFPAEERRKDLGVIRETRERFENAPIVRKSRALLAQGKQLVENIKTAWDEADTRAAALRELKTTEAKEDVAKKRAAYKETFDAALNKYKLAEAVAPIQKQIDDTISLLATIGKRRAKAVKEKDKETQRDLDVILQAERDALAELRKELESAKTAPGAFVEPAELPDGATRTVRGFTQPYELKAVADEWVVFERERLAKAEAKLEKLKGPERQAQTKVVADQRTALVDAEQAQKQAAIRAQQGLGLPGVRRKAGKVSTIESAEKQAAAKAQAEAERRAAAREDAAARSKAKEEKQTELEQRILDLGTERANKVAAISRARTPESKKKLAEEIKQLDEQARLAEAELGTVPMTRSEKRRAYKRRASLFSGRGVTSEKDMLPAIAQKIEDKIPLTAYEKKVWESRFLTPKERTQEKTAATRVSPEEEARQAEQESAQASARAAAQIAQKLRAQTQAQKRAAEKEEAAVAKEEKKAAPSAVEYEEYDRFFSRGKPAEGLTKEELIAELERALGQKGLLDTQNVVTIVDSVAELKAGHVYKQVGTRKVVSVSDIKKQRVSLPPALRDNIDTIPDDAKGFVYDGKAYLIAENIGKDHALGVLLHEVGAHIGFRNFFNTAQYNALVETVKRWSKSKANTLEAKIGRAAMERVEAAQTPEEQVDDELLAYAVEEAFNAGVEPSGVKGGTAVQNWLRMLVDGFKRALEKFGLAPKNLKVGDLVNMAYGAANLELRGTWHGTGKPFKEFDFTYMGTGEGAQVYGWGTYSAQKFGVADTYRKMEADKLLAIFKKDPNVKAWYDNLKNSITFNGKKISEFEEKENSLFKRVAQGIVNTISDTDFKTTPYEAAKYSAEYELENWLYPTKADYPGSVQAEQDIEDAKEILSKIIVGELNVKAPFIKSYGAPEPTITYKNRSSTQVYGFKEAEIDAVTSLLFSERVLAAKTKAEFEKAYFEELKEAELDLTQLLKANTKLRKDSRQKIWSDRLAALKALNFDDFNFTPLLTPPKEPKGALARTLSANPNTDYYVLDLPLNKQSQNVQDALARALANVPKPKKGASPFSEAPASDLKNRVKDLFEKTNETDRIKTPSRFVKRLELAFRDSGYTPKDVSMWLFDNGVAGYKFLDGVSRDGPITSKSTYNYVDFGDKAAGPQIVAWDIERIGPTENILFSRNLPTASRVADSLIAKEKGWLTKLKDNFLGMGGRMQYVDKLASSEEALKRGGTDPTKALQAMYYLRMYDQRMHFTSQSITDGVPELVEKTRRDGQTERLIETKPGANIKQIVDILKGKDVVKAAGSADAANKLFTLYLAAIRGERVGYDTLNFGRVWAEAEVKRIESQLKATNISQEQRAVLQKRKKSLEEKIPTMPTAADIKAARAEIEADPTLKEAFDEARDIYNQYNRNLLEFSVQTGALSREQANDYLRNNDYIPYYRMRDGVAELVIGNETPIRIGNLKDSPHLDKLVGGDEAIFDFLTSSVQNTSMLLDMATKNLATKNLMFELRDVGLATVSKVSKGGKVPEGAVTFKRDGEDYFAVVDTEAVGLDSELLVKGLAGIPTMFPAFVRVMGVPARFLRRAVVASPVYMARQLFRDTLAASMTSGADIVPVLSALKQIGKPNALQGRGITGGQVFTGMPEDVTRMLKDMQAGKISVTNGLAWLEAKSAQVDALTRQAQYESYLKQGLSELEATYMALESMNFSKRGLSPTIHMLSTLIPFFNAQIQGLDVLYKAFTGKMPMNERVAIREKLWTRGMMLFGMSVAYAMYMQDDETYKNAKPEEKYGNWFVRVPGFEQMVRLPIPFELGYVFKALPEALVNIAMREDGAEEAMKALKHIAQQMVPGGSSFMIPQALKPALEVLYGKSLYTLRDIESAREQMVEPGYRSRDNTTALAREVGELTGFSPVKMEYLIRGYTGGMGMALLAALSAPFGKEGPEAATKRASDIPVVGTLFQPNDASGIIDATYERMNEINRIKETYEDLLDKGRQADAQKYLKENIDDMALASVAGSFKQYMGQITTYERQIRASNMTPDQKREQLDKMRQAKINLATSVRAMVERKTPQAAPA